MENKPKKSKALIITIIILVILLLSAYLVYQNRDSFGVKASATIAKIFSPLDPSKNSTGIKTIAQAGEDIKKGDSVSVFGTGTGNNPIVVKSTNGTDVFGTANQDINTGDIGEILARQKGQTNGFFSSFSDFIGGLFGKEPTPDNIDPNINIPGQPIYECKKDNVVVDCSTIERGGSGETDSSLFPSITVTATPSNIKVGGNSRIEWSSQNTSDCMAPIDYNAGEGISGSLPTKPLSKTTSYTITCSGSKIDGNISKSVIVFVGTDTSTKLLPTIKVTTTPSSVDANGSSFISWTTTNVNSCKVAGDNTIYGSQEGFNTGELTKTKSYAITCEGDKGTIGGNATVIVNHKYECKKDKVVVDCKTIGDGTGTGGTGESGNTSLFPKVTVTASNSKISKGDMTTISWESKDAKSCDAHLGSSAGTGLSGSFTTDRLEKTTSYTVTCKNDNGTTNGNIIITVGTDQSKTLLPTVNVKASPTSITTNDVGSNISWTSTNSTTCDAGSTYKGTGTKGNFDTGRLTKSTAYTVTCAGPYGKSSDTVIVEVRDQNDTGSEGDITGGKPDLIASKVTPIVANVDAETTLSSIMRNIGGSSTVKSFPSFFTISASNENGTIVKTIATLDTIVPILEPTISGIAKVSYKFTTKGTYSIRACADKTDISDAGLITESNETNNCGEWTSVTVGGSDSVPTPGATCDNGATNYPDCTNFCVIDGFNSNKNTSNNTYSLSWHTTNCDSASISPQLGDINTVGSNISISPTSATNTYTLKAYNSHGELGDTKTTTINLAEVNQCSLIAENPLTFTDAEKARLAELLRKFYIIAPTLKTEDDIKMIYREIDKYNSLFDNLQNLTQKCYDQTSLASDYKGPTTRGGNPWYKYDERPSYINSTVPVNKDYCSGKVNYNRTWLEQQLARSTFLVWDGKNYGKNCDQFTTEIDCKYEETHETGCTWTPGANIDITEYEKILNIW